MSTAGRRKPRGAQRGIRTRPCLLQTVWTLDLLARSAHAEEQQIGKFDGFKML